ncbi:MAG: phosphoenolpyruvate--protein phosphotransferase [Endomicrobia bacterium]|nr:phosphoenolpyruvate--protein phosphotransferase [Endomicrobiia bacterium]
MKKERILKGIPASDGIAIGKVFVLERESELELIIPAHRIPKENVKKEIARYKEGLEQTKKQLEETKDRILKALGENHAKLIEAYITILDDRLFTHDVIKMIEEEFWPVEYSVHNAINKVIQMFERSGDDYFRGRIIDMKDVARKLLRNLLGKKRKDIKKIKKGDVVISSTLDPHDVIVLKERKCAGFITEAGTKTSHLALAAQGLGIPSIVGLTEITNEEINDGDEIIIDGYTGTVILHPSEGTFKEYKEKYEKHLKEQQMLIQLSKLPSVTTDGKKVVLLCNIDSPKDVDKVLTSSAEGVGLYRTEYQYTNRTTLPSEEELYEDYAYVAEKIYPKTVVIRTFDIGSDKLSELGLEGVKKEKASALGLRGIRLALKYPDLFKKQLKAILRASAKGNVKIMFPMISTVREVERIKELLQETKSELEHQGIPYDHNIKIGAMIETPSAALTTDMIAQKVDFISIGTNDLIQYVLAVDRFNENVAEMYEPLHLSVLRIIKHIVDAGHKYGKTISVCGEMAADTSFTEILIGLGIDELSVPAVTVLKVKHAIRETNFEKARKLVDEIIFTDSYPEVIKKTV